MYMTKCSDLVIYFYIKKTPHIKFDAATHFEKVLPQVCCAGKVFHFT